MRAVQRLTRSEAAEKKRFQQRQAQGKTSQAKSDLARLQEIRKKREAAAAQRVAEQEGMFVQLRLADRCQADNTEAAREAAERKDRLVRK